MARKDTQTLSFDFGTPEADALEQKTLEQASEKKKTPKRTAKKPLVEPLSVSPLQAPPPVIATPSTPESIPTVAQPETPAEPEVLSVAGLGRALKGAVDKSFPDKVLVEGEAIGVKASPTGHVYFSLKDETEDASVDVVMYKATLTPRVRALLGNGARVRLRGKPTYWSPRGRLQFVADRAEPAGVGALLAAIERLKAKLEAEGLFLPARKRALPPEPRIVGVVTSRTGAVIHDIRKVAFRRGGANILLSPAQVQGAGAAESIVRALDTLVRVQGVDVVIIGRGGGSLDDLMPFNDEAVVRAIADCPVPIVSAVGHEVDVTLADFAADLRAATPSQAAEFCVPDTSVRRAQLLDVRARLTRAVLSRADRARLVIERASRRLSDPRLHVAEAQSSLDERVFALSRVGSSLVPPRAERVVQLSARLRAQHPVGRIERQRASLESLRARLGNALQASVALRARALGESAARIDALSPLAVLGRGYALARTESGKLVRRAKDTSPGDVLQLRLEEGEVRAKVLP